MLTRAAAIAAVLLSAACMMVREEDDGRTKEVNISTPIGALAAKTGEDTGDTGLPVYRGAQLSRNGDTAGANVSISTPWFGLHVVSVKPRGGGSEFALMSIQH